MTKITYASKLYVNKKENYKIWMFKFNTLYIEKFIKLYGTQPKLEENKINSIPNEK